MSAARQAEHHFVGTNKMVENGVGSQGEAIDVAPTIINANGGALYRRMKKTTRCMLHERSLLPIAGTISYNGLAIGERKSPAATKLGLWLLALRRFSLRQVRASYTFDRRAGARVSQQLAGDVCWLFSGRHAYLRE